MTTPSHASEGAPRAADEADRVVALHHTRLLDGETEPEFDHLAALAATLCGTASGFFALIDHDRTWCKAGDGLAGRSCPRDADPAAWVIADDGVLVIGDLAADARAAAWTAPDGAPCQGLFAGASVCSVDGHRIGVLGVLDPRPRPLPAGAVRMLVQLAALATALVERQTLRGELEAARERARRLASVDELTGLLNRQTLLERLDLEVERAHRFRTPLALVLVDLDHFGAINEREGHAAGDAVLRAVGGVIRDELRQVDLAGRSGGGEFCIVLPGTPLAGAWTLAEALRQEIGRQEQGRDGARVTASLGVASLAGDADGMDLLRRAGEARSCAWQAGGDRTHGTVAPE